MICDKLENFDKYSALFPEEWALVKEFFTSGVTPEPGKYELLPDGKLKIAIQSYATHPFDQDKLEYHRDYLDIQLVLLGREDVLYSTIDGREVVQEYNPETDCGFNRLPEGEGMRFTLEVGNFAVFYPEEGHMPGLGDPDANVLKAVVKLKIN